MQCCCDSSSARRFLPAWQPSGRQGRRTCPALPPCPTRPWQAGDGGHGLETGPYSWQKWANADLLTGTAWSGFAVATVDAQKMVVDYFSVNVSWLTGWLVGLIGRQAGNITTGNKPAKN